MKLNKQTPQHGEDKPLCKQHSCMGQHKVGKGMGTWGCLAMQDKQAGAGGNLPLKSMASPRGTGWTKQSQNLCRHVPNLCPTQPTNPKSHQGVTRALCTQANQAKGR